MSTDTLDYQMNFEDSQQAEADKKLLAVFFTEAVECGFKSQEAGRPIFEDQEMIRIMFPGQRDTVVSFVNPSYIARFPTQYARYKAGREQLIEGTPLSALTWLTQSQIAEFKAVNCHTVEQLVGMPDNVAVRFMGHNAIKQRATTYLTLAKDAAPMLKMAAELEKRDEQIAELQRAVEAMRSVAKAPPKA